MLSEEGGGGGGAETAEIEISNEQGEIVRTLTGTTSAGVNRVWWNLAGEPITMPRLRTKPLRYSQALPSSRRPSIR